MAKIESKAGLTGGTNLFLHIADKGGTDVSLTNVAGIEWTISSATAAWTTTGAADADGIVNRGIVVGDVITLSHMGTAANEGFQGTVTGVTATDITVDYIADSAAGVPVDEVAGSDINVLAFKKTYQFAEAGGLSFIDGVQGIVLASELVDMWDTLDLDKYDRPFTSIEPRAKSLASLNGWEPHDLDTQNAIRDTALEIRDSATAAARKIYALWRSGDLDESTDQFYFWPSSDAALTAPTGAVMTGYINQLFLIYDADGADNRNTNGGITWFTRCAEVGKTIVMQEHVVSYAEIMPVSAANAIDPKLVASDVTIGAGGIYANIDITNATLDYSGDVDGTPYDFDILIEGDSQLNQTVHEKVNYLLRQPTDINQSADEVMRGDKQWPITSFSGEVFTIQGYLANFNSAQRNDLRVVDVNSITRQWPSIMTLIVNAAAIAIGGTFSIFHSDTYGTNDAVYFQNESAVEQKDVSITGSNSVVMAYSTYSVNGHTGGEPLPVTITYNRPGFIEPDKITATLSGSNLSVSIAPTPDPSYIA